jgi:flagellar biosynthesis/type III secretory pathway M-ring protein FliF/YscJ
MRDHDPRQHHGNGADFDSQLQRFEFTGTISMFAASFMTPSQLMFIAGVVLLAWILFRRQMISKRRMRAEALESNKTLAAQKAESERSLRPSAGKSPCSSCIAT